MEVVVREIRISTDVFARIWSLREMDEDSEDAILRRLLWKIEDASSAQERAQRKLGEGLLDQRYGVLFPEGFQIERTYLGSFYSARVQNGQWVIEGRPGRYSKLNELSRAIGTKTENAWVNWFFIDREGIRHPVSTLRDPNKITSRGNSKNYAKFSDLYEQNSQDTSDAKANEVPSWRDILVEALTNLGGDESLNSIYREAERLRRQYGGSVTEEFKATIRRTLEDNCSDSDNFRGEDLFMMPKGKGQGIWALRG